MMAQGASVICQLLLALTLPNLRGSFFADVTTTRASHCVYVRTPVSLVSPYPPAADRSDLSVMTAHPKSISFFTRSNPAMRR